MWGKRPPMFITLATISADRCGMEATPEEAKGRASPPSRRRAMASCGVRAWKLGGATTIIGPVPTTAMCVKSPIGS